MTRKTFAITLVFLLVQVFGLIAAPVSLRPATQGEVNSGANVNAFVTPAGLQNSSGLTFSNANLYGPTLNNPVINSPTVVGPTNVAMAGETTNGLISSNAFVQAEWFPDQQTSLSPTPPLGIASWYGAFAENSWTNVGAVIGISNALWYANQTLYPSGYRYLQLDDGWGQTNLDANNLMQLNAQLAWQFGSVSNFIAGIHTNGWRIGLYFDGGTNLSTAQYQHGVGGYLLWTNMAALGRYGLDAMKSDQSLYDKERIAGVIAANGYPVFLSGSVQFSGVDGPLPTVTPAFMNGYRLVSGGDITSYAQLLRWCDVAMTNNWWAWVRPGHFIDMDYVGGESSLGGFTASKTHFVIDALFSAPIWDGCNLALNAALNPIATNAALLQINQDPAVICARRWMQTNGCDVYVKPLGSPNGPQFALGVVNRSSVSPATVSLTFSNLPPLFGAGPNVWSAYDCCTNNGWVLNGTNAFTVTIGTNDSILWRLVPGFAMQTNVVAANFPDSEVVNVVSNGVPFTFYQSWDTDASNYVARAGLTNQTEILCAATAVALGKTHGWWGKMDCLYLFLGSTSNSTAQNLISSSYPVKWTTTGVTYGWNGVTGDGSTGFGDTQFNPSTAPSPKYSQTSASMLFYNQTPAPTVNLGAFMGARGTAWAGAVYTTSSTVVTMLGMNFANFGSAATSSSDGVTGNAAGPWFIDRNEGSPWFISGNSYTEILYHNFNSDAGDSTASTGVPNANIYLLANNNGGAGNYQACTLSAAAIGAGFTEKQYFQFLTDLNVIETMHRQRIP